MSEILDILREEVPREIEARVPAEDARSVNRGRCVQATRVGIEALRYFGITGKPLVTLMLTGNAAWAEWMLAGSPQPMPDEVWSVGINPNDDGPGFPAHLVISLDGLLLDLDAGFYARPERGIHVPPTILAPIEQKIEDGPIAGVDLDEGGAIIYGRHFAPPQYTGSGAWKNTATWAGPVIRRMRERLT
jgi:hypothetical protein